MTLALCLKPLGESVHGGDAGRESALGKPPVKFGDLEMHRIIGTGQFGMVRVVRHKKSGEVYALKVGSLVLCMVLQKKSRHAPVEKKSSGLPLREKGFSYASCDFLFSTGACLAFFAISC